MIVAITGGTGFIGAEIARRHREMGDTVRVLSRTTGPYRADLTDPDAALGPFVAQADVLYHCAGEIHDPQRMRHLHLEGTRQLIRAASGSVGHWVQLSSVGAYGPRRSGLVTEATEQAPVGLYETTKTASDEMVSAAAASAAFGCTLLRPSNVIGPTMKNQSAFQLISAIAKGIFVFIGPPGAQTNYVHVANVAEAALLCSRRSASGVDTFIVSDGCSFEDFAQGVADQLGKAAPRLRIPTPLAAALAATAGRVRGFPLTGSRLQALTTRASYSQCKLEQDLHYVPPVSMADAIAEMVAAWRARTNG